MREEMGGRNVETETLKSEDCFREDSCPRPSPRLMFFRTQHVPESLRGLVKNTDCWAPPTTIPPPLLRALIQ